MHSFAVVLAVASLGMVAVPVRADAEEKAEEKAGTITLAPITVVGTHRRPTVVIEVARAKPVIKLKDLQDPAVQKIIRAAEKAPF